MTLYEIYYINCENEVCITKVFGTSAADAAASLFGARLGEFSYIAKEAKC